MSDIVFVALISAVVSGISIGITYLIGMWVNKRKVPSEVRQLDADTNLKSGDLIEKYRGIAERTADDNIDLAKQLREREDEKNQLMQAMNKLRSDMEEQNILHNKEIEALKKSFEEERKENEKWRDWARRLVLQLDSWLIQPVPFDIENAKKNKLSLGDMGSTHPQDSNIE